MTAPADREFVVFRRGEIKDLTLNHFRAGLRQRTNPETGALFTEDEIAQATAPGSRWHRQASAIDDYAQGEQRRALFLNDQMRINRSCTAWIAEYHARQWDPGGRLEATAGSGTVTVTGTVGTRIIGSTTIGDSTAYWGRDPNGVAYQVTDALTIIGSSGTAEVTMQAMDAGSDTNPEAGTIITWSKRDPNMATQATVADDFAGGTDDETDAEWVSRIEGEIRNKQGAGNEAQQRAWARRASNAIEDGFVYSCAFHANSTLICLTQKRGTATGPDAQVAGAGTLATATAYLVPPGSPVQPANPMIVVTTFQPEEVDVCLHMSLPKGAVAGFVDAQPFPAHDSATLTQPRVSATGAGSFTLEALDDDTLPGQAALATLTGADCPSMMWWNKTTSRWQVLELVSIVDLGSNSYTVTPVGGIPTGLTTGTVISPLVPSLAESIAVAVEQYFDERGPGQLFDLDTDTRGSRCIRFPDYAQERPFRVGAEVATRAIDALGGSATDATAPIISKTEPSYPSDLTDGPYKLTLGQLGLFPL